jgi:hypothetical protein
MAVSCFTEEEFPVNVEYITVDFAADVKVNLYDVIWEGLAGKEIGILGKILIYSYIYIYIASALY